jgi:hypothetical protein
VRALFVATRRRGAPARPAGEHLYEDKTSLVVEEVQREEAIMPARVRGIHRDRLGKLEAERGDRCWVFEG